MIKAVFFDFYNTLITFDPSREELQARACLDFGIEVDRSVLSRGYWIADDLMSRENARSPIHRRSQEEGQEFWTDYETALLKEAGIEISREMAYRIFTRLRQLDRRLILFDDVIPVLEMLKYRGIVSGLVSNLSRSLDAYCRELGLTTYIEFALSSAEVGAEKPHPLIFMTAIENAHVDVSEVIHIGDQYYADVIGARGAGISPLLLDRDGFWSNIDDCPRISSLAEVADYLD